MNNVSVFTIENFDKWTHQNRAEYTGAFVEGSLLDNFVMTTKRGYAFIYEKPLNTWSSCYLCYFVPYKELENGAGNAVDRLWADWYSFEESA